MYATELDSKILIFSHVQLEPEIMEAYLKTLHPTKNYCPNLDDITYETEFQNTFSNDQSNNSEKEVIENPKDCKISYLKKKTALKTKSNFGTLYTLNFPTDDQSNLIGNCIYLETKSGTRVVYADGNWKSIGIGYTGKKAFLINYSCGTECYITAKVSIDKETKPEIYSFTPYRAFVDKNLLVFFKRSLYAGEKTEKFTMVKVVNLETWKAYDLIEHPVYKELGKKDTDLINSVWIDVFNITDNPGKYYDSKTKVLTVPFIKDDQPYTEIKVSLEPYL